MTQAGIQRFSNPDHHPGTQTFGLKAGKIVGFNYEDHTVDAILHDGSTYSHCPLLEMWAGTDYGDLWNPQFAVKGDTLAWNQGEDGTGDLTGRRDCLGVFAFFEGVDHLPICLGFYYDEVTQMMYGFQRLTRHVGDSYAPVAFNDTHYLAFDKDGTAICFDQGDPEPPVMTGTDYDKRSQPTNGGYNITLITASGSKVKLDGQTGDITIESKNDLAIVAARTLTIKGSPLVLDGLQGVYF